MHERAASPAPEIRTKEPKARELWQRPELTSLPIEETANFSYPGSDGAGFNSGS